MTAKEDILRAIASGCNDSRKLAEELHYTQEYVRRVANELAAEGVVEIIREPRGNLYRIKNGLYGTGELKLFVWTDFSPDYTGGLAFAIAETKSEAKELVLKELDYKVDDWGTLEVRPISKCAYSVPGGA